MFKKPIIYVWCDPYKDPFTPGVIAKAMAPDGVVIHQQVIKQRGTDMVKKLMGLGGEPEFQKEYLAEFPKGYELRWEDHPENNPAIIAAIMRRHNVLYAFASKPRHVGFHGKATETEMYVADTAETIGFIYLAAFSPNYYARAERAEDGEISLGVAYGSMRDAAEALHAARP